MSLFYKLVGHEPIRCTALEGASVLSSDRTVAKDELQIDGESVLVSTVFLGLDYGYGEDRPIVFETMIFGGKQDGYQYRYATWDEAEEGHKVAVAIAQGSLARNP